MMNEAIDGGQCHSLVRKNMTPFAECLICGDQNGSMFVSAMLTGEAGKALEDAFPRFVADLTWWAEAAKAQRTKQAPPH